MDKNVELIWPKKNQYPKISTTGFQPSTIYYPSMLNLNRKSENTGIEQKLGQISVHEPEEVLTDLSSRVNQLIWGDNLQILHYLKKISDHPLIDLIYIDPPFATGDSFPIELKLGQDPNHPTKPVSSYEMTAYHDKWNGELENYLRMLQPRLQLMKNVLKETGSLFIHLDWHVCHYVKVLLDEIFGADQFRAEIIWQRTGGHHLSKNLDVMTDSLYWYTKSDQFTYHQPYQQLSSAELKQKFPYIEEETGRRFTHEKLEQSSNRYSKGETRIIQGKAVKSDLGWRWTQQTFDERLAHNPYLIYWTENGKPRYKRYADEYKGRKVGNLWNDIAPLTSNQTERVAVNYPTQKPEALLNRIITMCSDEGDLVADFFCGSGTTGIVAEKLNRRWILADIAKIAVETTKKRFLMMINHPKTLTRPFCVYLPDKLVEYYHGSLTAYQNPDALHPLNNLGLNLCFNQKLTVKISITQEKNHLKFELTECNFKYPNLTDRIRKKLSVYPFALVDAWAIGYSDSTIPFVPFWQSFRTERHRALNLTASISSIDIPSKDLIIQVFDIFGNEFYQPIPFTKN